MNFFKGRTPTILQMEATECGAACLAMVLSAHDKWITLEEARTSCGTSRDGVNAASLLVAARSYGMKAKALKREPEDLAKLPMPQILHWRFEHFVVLESVRGNKFTLLDPAVGRRVVDAKEMSRSFTGLTIAMQPGDDFEASGERPSVIGKLINVARQSPQAIAVSFLTTLISVFPGLALSGAIAIFVDHIAQDGQPHWVPYLLATLAGLALLMAGLSFVKNRVVAAFKAKVATITAIQCFWHALYLPLSFYAQRSAGEVISRLRLGSEIGGLVAGPIAELAPQALIALIYLGFLALYNPVLAAVALVVCAINLGVLTMLASRVADRNRELQLAEGRANGTATSGISAIDTYRMLGREDMLVAKWAIAEDAALNTAQRLGLLRSLSELGPTASRLMLSAAVLCVGAFLVMNGQMTIGGLVAAQVIVGLLNRPIAMIASSLCQMQEAAGALMRIQDLTSHPLAPAFRIDEKEAPPASRSGALQLRNVSFGYTPNNKVVDGVDLDIAPGKMVAILGKSGSGKSTIARLAAGLATPEQGTVMLDGRTLDQWPSEELRKELIYVTQNASVFTGTIAENIQMWNAAITPRDLFEAAHAAGLDAALARHRHGLNTKLSQSSGGMSGGELQRMTLARALAHKPKVLVLDETTSALDPHAEADVLQGLRNSGAAALIVTHKHGTAMRCDEAIVVENGRIIDRGPPAQMLHAISERPLHATQKKHLKNVSPNASTQHVERASA